MSVKYEVGGPWDAKDPVHENLVVLTLRQAIETAQKQDPKYVRGALLTGVELKSLPAWDSKLLDPKKAPKCTQEFIRGVYWPDDPKCLLFGSARGTEDFSTGVLWLGEFVDGKHLEFIRKDPSRLIARSHFGDLQFFHAMATAFVEPAQRTKSKMLEWARFNVDVAMGRINPDTQIKNIQDPRLALIPRSFTAHWEWTVRELFAGDKDDGKKLLAKDVCHRATGILLHMVQDSFAEGHAEREAGYGPILQFHEYSAQAGHKHSAKDAMGAGKTLKEHIGNTPGAMQAIEAGAQVVLLLDSAKPTDEIITHFDDQLFKLSAEVRAAGPGKEFQKEKNKMSFFQDVRSKFEQGSRDVNNWGKPQW